MIKLTVLYHHPTDPEAFERHYAEVHRPLAEKLAAARRETSLCLARPGEDRSPYYRISETWYEDATALVEAMASPEGKTVTDDMQSFATAGVTVVLSALD